MKGHTFDLTNPNKTIVPIFLDFCANTSTKGVIPTFFLDTVYIHNSFTNKRSS